MKLLITGGAGFVPLSLAEAALEAGHRVVLFDRLDIPAPAQAAFARFGDRLAIERGDVLDRIALGRVLAQHGIDTIAHAAAITAGTERERREPATIATVNLLGTIAVIEAARGGAIRRFLQFSTGSTYGRVAPESGALDEETTPLRPWNLYGISKAAAERTAARLDELDPFGLVIARLGPVFGPWEWATGVRDTLSPMFQATLLALRGRTASLAATGVSDWIYSRDVARGLLALLESERPRWKVYNVGTGRRWPVTEWCARLAEAFPAFAWSLAEPDEEANVAVSPPRAPLATWRIEQDLGFAARFPGDSGFDDFLAWLDAGGRSLVLGE